MQIKRGLVKYLLLSLITLVILILIICPLVVPKAAESSAIGYEVPVYNIPIPENTQRDIWKLCEKNKLSYELVLAVFQIEGDNNMQIDSIKAVIEKLAYYRDYWTEQGFPDEIVFNLMLLSKQRGIEGCKVFMENSDTYESDNYVQKVTEYKYYLEKIDSDNINM
ncbi:hypothetical protein [Dehalobacter sp. 4CP]|uniref:hypothetical protein n=1 Tax=Dehalobacter sp. CP TaxID=2594474 RepID=UPI0039ECF91D|nr:hypothetical protein [Dehalobacter sp.]